MDGIIHSDHGISSPQNNILNSKETNNVPASANLGQQKDLASTLSESLTDDSRDVEKDVLECHPRSSANEPPALFPPNPMTGQAGGYDPNRIPSSVFNSKPATPMEWSVASTESLFSIHMGNNSFSKELAFPIYRSGEFPETISPSPTLFPFVEKPSEDISKESKVTEEKLPEPVKVDPELPVNKKTVGEEKELVKNVGHEKIPPAEEVRNSSSSTHSFHFPVLETNTEGNTSAKVMMGKMPSNLRQESQEQIKEPETAKRPGGRSWFPCFSCCSFGL